MSESVRAVDRALDILLCFTQEKPLLSLTEISEKAGISKSTVHRLLATLESKRFLVRTPPANRYHLGYCFLEMASQVSDGARHRWALPYLESLAKQWGETVDLAVMDGDAVIYLQVVESPQRVKIAAAIGQRLPAYCTATGKAFLAYLPRENVRKILDSRLARHTDHTLTDLSTLEKDLEETRQRGFAISRQEYERDIHAVAAPILDVDGYPLVAIAIAGPAFRLPEERMLECGRAIQDVIRSVLLEVGLSALSVMMPREDAGQ